jgi:hypothetical protein
VSNPDSVRTQGFYDQKFEKIYSRKYFFKSKTKFPYPWASIKDVQVTKVAFSSQREHPARQNMKFLPSWIRIRIPNTDPDPLT